LKRNNIHYINDNNTVLQFKKMFDLQNFVYKGVIIKNSVVINEASVFSLKEINDNVKRIQNGSMPKLDIYYDVGEGEEKENSFIDVLYIRFCKAYLSYLNTCAFFDQERVDFLVSQIVIEETYTVNRYLLKFPVISKDMIGFIFENINNVDVDLYERVKCENFQLKGTVVRKGDDYCVEFPDRKMFLISNVIEHDFCPANVTQRDKKKKVGIDIDVFNAAWKRGAFLRDWEYWVFTQLGTVNFEKRFRINDKFEGMTALEVYNILK
jgi:hypothetical protein